MSDPIGASPYLWAAQPSVINVTGGGGGSALVQWGPHFGGPTGDVNNIGINTTMPALAATYPMGVGIRAGLPGSAPIQVGSLAINYNTLGVGIHQAASVLGAPFFQSVGTIDGPSNVQPIVIPKPAGLSVGDLMLAFVGSGSTALTTMSTFPTGFTQILNQQQNGVALKSTLNSSWKIADSSDVAASNFSFTLSTAQAYFGCILRFNGNHATTPINVSAGGNGSATNPIAPTVTTTVVNCMIVVACAQANAVAVTYTAPTNYIERTDQDGTQITHLMDGCTDTRVQAAIAASGAQTITSSGLVAGDYASQTIAIAPGALVLT